MVEGSPVIMAFDGSGPAKAVHLWRMNVETNMVSNHPNHQPPSPTPIPRIYPYRRKDHCSAESHPAEMSRYVPRKSYVTSKLANRIESYSTQTAPSLQTNLEDTKAQIQNPRF